MIYGSASLNDVPWETVIKVYRAQLGGKQFDTVQDYADDFLSYLTTNATVCSDERKQAFVVGLTARYFGHVRALMIEAVEAAAEASGPLKLRDARRVALKVIADQHKTLTARDAERAGRTRR